MWKKNGTPVNISDQSPGGGIAGELGSGKSVLIEKLVNEEAARRGISYEEAYKEMHSDLDKEVSKSGDPGTSTD